MCISVHQLVTDWGYRELGETWNSIAMKQLYYELGSPSFNLASDGNSLSFLR